jgi:hypothetical protein
MLASILIIVFSFVMLVYWFRYTCLLILRSEVPEDCATRVATTNRLSFLSVEDRLKSAAETAALDPLEQALANDFRVLRFLLQHGSGPESQTIEQRILVLDYKILQLWYRIARMAAPPRAHRALEEMSAVLKHLAGGIGQRFTGQVA